MSLLPLALSLSVLCHVFQPFLQFLAADHTCVQQVPPRPNTSTRSVSACLTFVPIHNLIRKTSFPLLQFAIISPMAYALSVIELVAYLYLIAPFQLLPLLVTIILLRMSLRPLTMLAIHQRSTPLAQNLQQESAYLSC